MLSVFRPHSHDAADSVDSALEASSEGVRAVKVSLVGLGVTAVAQLLVVLVTGSVALLADTIHNFSDALTAIPLWVAFVLSRRAANRRYTYGYGRAEDLAGVFIVVMIAVSAVLAGYESIRRLIDPQPVTQPWIVAGRRADRVRRQRAGRGLPDPGRPQDRVRRAGRRRAARPHRRVHLPGRGPRRGRGDGRVAVGRPDRRAADHRRDPRPCCAAPPGTSTGG